MSRYLKQISHSNENHDTWVLILPVHSFGQITYPFRTSAFLSIKQRSGLNKIKLKESIDTFFSISLI